MLAASFNLQLFMSSTIGQVLQSHGSKLTVAYDSIRAPPFLKESIHRLIPGYSVRLLQKVTMISSISSTWVTQPKAEVC